MVFYLEKGVRNIVYYNRRKFGRLFMYKVLKRDNTVTEFDITKISGAIAKAFDAMEKDCERPWNML